MNSVVLIGYSGHAFVVADILILTGYNIKGYFDKEEKQNNPYHLTYLGNENDQDLISSFNYDEYQYFLSIGDNNLRRSLDKYLLKQGLSTFKANHPGSTISKATVISEGTLICGGAIINPLVKIGRCCIINSAAIIEHEAKIEAYCHVGPGAVLAGNVKVGEASFIGSNAVVKEGIQIGKNVTIGAGSVVLKDVPDNEVWVGNPARQIRKLK